ncbi:MAG: CPBP family intramembrane metalloprotease, partial [Theionarchaea archaeon]|nr:CPBP family intramembrane metalloprotease [Theionarchaea archaeon]
MKNMVGVICVVLIFFTAYDSGESPDSSSAYRFNLAWNLPPHSSSDTHFTDLDGNGLTEILYFDRDEKDNSIFVVRDTFGSLVWSIPFDIKPSYLMFHDVDEDGHEEIFFTTRLTSYSDEEETGEGWRKIACYTWNGDFVWSHTWCIHPEFSEYTGERRTYGFIDFNGDGIQDIIVNNFTISTKGMLHHEYGDDFNYIGGICTDDIPGCHLVLVREKAVYKVGLDEYRFQCKIITFDGTVLWEKEYTEYTRAIVENIEGEKRFFLIQAHKVIEIDLTTFEEKIFLEFFCNENEIFLPEFSIKDIDNDGQIEYIVAFNNYTDFGTGMISVFDHEAQLIISYEDPSFHTEIMDIDGDGYYEFLLTYSVDLSTCGPSPFIYRVLNHVASPRWTMVLNAHEWSTEESDLDADGDIELIFEMDLEPKTCDPDMSLEEALQKLREIMENPPPPHPQTEYLYVFGPSGNIEKQIEVPFSGTRYFLDLDADGDEDLVYHVKRIDEGLYIFSNTRFPGPLDTLFQGNVVSEVDMGDIGVTRAFSQDPALYYGLSRLEYFFKKPYLTPLEYRRKMAVLLSIPAGLGLVGIAFLTLLLKKEPGSWDTPWGGKKAVSYLLFLFFPPAGLIFFMYRIWKSDAQYRSALGFIRIKKYQFLGALGIGVVLLMITWGATYLYVLTRIYTPDGETAAYVQQYSALALLSIVITAPFLEEILFTGYLYPLLRNKWDIYKGIIVISLLFSVLHLECVLIPLFFGGAFI